MSALYDISQFSMQCLTDMFSCQYLRSIAVYLCYVCIIIAFIVADISKAVRVPNFVEIYSNKEAEIRQKLQEAQVGFPFGEKKKKYNYQTHVSLCPNSKHPPPSRKRNDIGK